MLVLGLTLISGCGASPSVAPPSGESERSEGGQGEDEIHGHSTQDSKIVKEGSITLEVEDIAGAMDEVAEMAGELNGYVVSSYQHEYERGVSGYISIRIPVEEFEEALDRLRQLALAVPYETTEARDVTEEYVDLEAQLSNLQATEAQYLVLLEKAETVEDILKVQKELSSGEDRLSKLRAA